jgi:hypothetical protein
VFSSGALPALGAVAAVIKGSLQKGSAGIFGPYFKAFGSRCLAHIRVIAGDCVEFLKTLSMSG